MLPLGRGREPLRPEGSTPETPGHVQPDSLLRKSVTSGDLHRRECRCQNRQISGRGSQTVRLRLMVTGGRGHDVYLGSGPLDGGNTLLPA